MNARTLFESVPFFWNGTKKGEAEAFLHLYGTYSSPLVVIRLEGMMGVADPVDMFRNPDGRSYYTAVRSGDHPEGCAVFVHNKDLLVWLSEQGINSVKDLKVREQEMFKTAQAAKKQVKESLERGEVQAWYRRSNDSFEQARMISVHLTTGDDRQWYISSESDGVFGEVAVSRVFSRADGWSHFFDFKASSDMVVFNRDLLVFMSEQGINSYDDLP